MFIIQKEIPKPIEYRIVYNYNDDICLEYKNLGMFSPISRKNQSFSPKTKKTERVKGRKYDRYNLPHDTNANWEIFGNNIVVTIDDSYDFPQIRAMFEFLKENSTTATFFPNTDYINPDNKEHVRLWREIYDSGYEIGYHTTDHHRKKSVRVLEEDFSQFTEKMRGILNDYNFTIKVVRAPYGYFDTVWMRWVEENNLLNVRWTITDNEDGNYLRELYSKGKGRVLLLHNKEGDVEWLRNHIDEFKQISKEKGGKLGCIYDSIVR